MTATFRRTGATHAPVPEMSLFVRPERPSLSDMETAILRRCIERGEPAAHVARDLGLSLRQAYRLKRSALQKWLSAPALNGFHAALGSPGIETRLARALGVSRRTIYRMARSAAGENAKSSPYALLERYGRLRASRSLTGEQIGELEMLLHAQALLLQRAGRLDDARAVFLELRAVGNSHDTGATFTEACLLRDDLRIPGRFTHAYRSLKSLARHSDAHPLALASLARAALRAGKRDPARRYAAAALQTAFGSNDRFDAARLRIDVGHLYADLGATASAAAILAATAQAIEPRDRSRWLALAARLKHAQGQPNAAESLAVQVIADSLADERDRGEAEIVLAEIFERRGDARIAAGHAETAAALLERRAFLERFVYALETAARITRGGARRRQLAAYREALTE